MATNKNILAETKKTMIVRYPLFAQQIANAKLSYSNEISTACTDGKNIYFNHNYFDNLSDNDKLFVIAHELLHIRFEHMYRLVDKQGKRRDMYTWNVATDAIINANLERDGFTIPEGAIKIEGALSYTAEQLYEKLMKEKKENQNQNGDGQDGEQSEQGDGNKSQDQGGNGSQNQNGSDNESQQGDNQNSKSSEQQNGQQDNQSQSNDGQSSNDNKSQQDGQQDGQSSNGNKSQQNNQGSKQSQKGGKGSGNSQYKFYDDHSMWEKAFEEKQNEEKNGKKDNQDNSQDEDQDEGKENNDSNNDTNKGKKKQSNDGSQQNRISDASDIDEISDFDEKKMFEENRKARLQKAKEKLDKIKDIVRQSTLSNNEFTDLGKSKPVADWKLLLKKKFDNDETIWSQHRSIAENNYAYRMTDFEDENESITEVMLDVSGSIPDSFIKSFLRQLKPILKESKLKVACFDTMVTEFTELKTDKDIDRYHISRMTGGTDLDLPVRSFTKDPKVNKIVFTDGESYDMPQKDLEDIDVIWIVYDNKNFKPCCGKVINVKSSEFKQKSDLIINDNALTM